jgi:hypothetical protein
MMMNALMSQQTLGQHVTAQPVVNAIGWLRRSWRVTSTTVGAGAAAQKGDYAAAARQRPR